MQSIRLKTILLFVTLLSALTSVTAENYKAPPVDLIIGATKTETPTYKLGSSVTVIDSQEIKASKKTRLLELLKTVPSLDVIQSGGSGGNTSIFIRGANSEHTLVLLDGIELNNPGSTNRSYNFVDLSLDNVERIEILKGPQSVLYGSDAIGGVINIITTRGSGAPSAQVSAEAGSYDTAIEKGAVSGSSQSINYSFAASREDSGGISAASSRSGNSEDDGYQNTSLSARIGATLSDQSEISLYSRYTQARAEIDNNGGVGADDPNRITHNDQTFLRAEAKTGLLENVQSTLGVSYSNHSFDDDNDIDDLNPLDTLRSSFDGELLKFDLQNNVDLGRLGTVILGAETEEEKASSVYKSDGEFGPFESNFSERSARSYGFYLQDQVELGQDFFLAIGGRYDQPDTANGEFSWRIAPTYLFKESGTQVKGTYGTGFKAPSLVQLYADFGNPELEAEESRGWDIGIEQEFEEQQLQVGVTYFSNQFDNLISFDPQTFIFENISEAESSGFETFAKFLISDASELRVSYTYTDTEDKVTGESLLRRSRHKLNSVLSAEVFEDTEVRVSSTLVGSKFDNDFSTLTPTRVKLGSYTLVDIAAVYRGFESFELSLNVDNLFDKEYEDVLGFGTKGLAAYAGIKFTL